MSIQASELRIGNFYKGDSSGMIEIATGGTIAQIEDGKLNAFPIILTDEILVSWFKYKCLDGISFMGRVWLIKVEDQYVYRHHKNDDIHTFIKYVHQLQNLHFALLGEEIQVHTVEMDAINYKDQFYHYGESLGISINDLQRLMSLAKKSYDRH